MTILGRYRITHPEGHIQEKNLIPHAEYEAVKDHKEELKKLGEFFTDQSPMFDAIKTGILKTTMGDYPTKVEKI